MRFTNILLVTILGIAALSAFLASGAEVPVLGAASDFNMFILGSPNTNTALDMVNGDCWGRVAVWGNMRVSSFGVADHIDCHNSDPNIANLIVSGSLDYSNGQLFCGSFCAGDVINAPSLGQQGAGRVSCDGCGLNWDSARDWLYNVNSDLCNSNCNSADDDGFGGVEFNGNNDDVQFFSIRTKQINNAKHMQFNIPNSDAIVIVNVFGDVCSFSNFAMDIGNMQPNNFLWNFCHTKSITVDGFEFNGSMLCPNSDMNLRNGQVLGQIVCGSVKGTGGGECHNFPFKGKECVDP